MRRCSERMELTLADPKLAIPVLDDMGFTNYQVTDKEHIITGSSAFLSACTMITPI